MKIVKRESLPLRGLPAIDLVGAALEGRGKAAKRGLEHPAHQDAQGAAAELVGDKKFDIASAVACRPKTPAIVHFHKRAFEIFYQNFELRALERHAALEGLADELVGNRHVGDDHLFPDLFDRPLAYAQRLA